MQNKIKLLTVTGPTASGKTALAVGLALRFNGEIISADSMQIYTDMQIATAKPDEEEKKGVPHHLMDYLPPDQSYSVARFVSDAKECISEIFSRGRLPIIAGGTGLYIDSLLNNVSFFGEKRDETLCAELDDLYRQQGVEPLLKMLSEFDAPSAERLAAERNPKRIIRAIEFYRTTGITITEQNLRSKSQENPYSAVKIGLGFRDREKLYERINRRVDIMLERGLLDEAKRVLSSELSFTSGMAIGYKELAPYFEGRLTLEECTENLKRETRRYAKRQLTWFRRDKEINWLYVDDYEGFEALLADAVSITEKGLRYG